MVLVLAVIPILDADAAKAKGTSTKSFGTKTKSVICGDKLCSETKRDGKSDQQSRYAMGGVAQQAARVKSTTTTSTTSTTAYTYSDNISFTKTSYAATDYVGVWIGCNAASTLSAMDVTVSGPKSSKTVTTTARGAMPGTFAAITDQYGMSLLGPASNYADAGSQITATSTCGSTTLSASVTVSVSGSTTDVSSYTTTQTQTVSPSLSVSDMSIMEGASSQKPIINIPVSVSGTIPSGGISLTITITDQTTASSGKSADYVKLSRQQQNVVITSPLYNIPVTINGDSTYEQNETFLVTISTTTANVAISKATAIATVINDDPDPNAPPSTTPTYSDSILFWKSSNGYSGNTDNYATTDYVGVQVACNAASTMSSIDITVSGPKLSKTVTATGLGAMPGTFYATTDQYGMSVIGLASSFADSGSQITATTICGSVTLSRTAGVQ